MRTEGFEFSFLTTDTVQPNCGSEPLPRLLIGCSSFLKWVRKEAWA